MGPGNKIPWRHDSHVDDKGTDGEDLSGTVLYCICKKMKHI